MQLKLCNQMKPDENTLINLILNIVCYLNNMLCWIEQISNSSCETRFPHWSTRKTNSCSAQQGSPVMLIIIIISGKNLLVFFFSLFMKQIFQNFELNLKSPVTCLHFSHCKFLRAISGLPSGCRLCCVSLSFFVCFSPEHKSLEYSKPRFAVFFSSKSGFYNHDQLIFSFQEKCKCKYKYK